jgi:hypothetical protein
VISGPFESYSTNGADVVLWRALQDVGQGRYVDLGAGHPTQGSISMAFYAHGWRGITVEPDAGMADLQRRERPGDLLIEAAVTGKEGGPWAPPVVDRQHESTSGQAAAARTRRIDAILQDAGWATDDLHFLSIRTGGTEGDALEGIDLTVWRPWILVIEAAPPLSAELPRTRWEPPVTASGYGFCLFDGASCFYVSDEHRHDLGPALSYPACRSDNYTTLEDRELTERLSAIPDLIEEVTRWRSQAMTRWATAVARLSEISDLRAQLEALRLSYAESEHRYQGAAAHAAGLQRKIDDFEASTSWRMTRPLRAFTGWVDPDRRPPETESGS